MRIRKNAKLSPLLFASSSSAPSPPCAAAASSSSISSQQGQGGSSSVPVVTFQTHVCQLNQSPWDVIPFDSDPIQFEGGDSFTAGNGGGSAGDSVGAVESVASMMKIDDDNHDNYRHKVVAAENSCCIGVDGKGWPCKNEPKKGQSFCHHHLSLLRSYNNNNNKQKGVAVAAVTPAATAVPMRRGRARAATGKKTAAASNPSEFYYYSGFGPSWGKRRGDRNSGRGENNNSAVAESENVVIKATSEDNAAAQNIEIENNIEDVEFDYVDNDEEEEDIANDDDSGKKRMRKPVKARSLKSLM